MIAYLPSRNSSTQYYVVIRTRPCALIVWGKADGVIAPAYAEEFAQRVAHARVAMLDGAGHMPHFEQAERVAKLVGEFLGD